MLLLKAAKLANKFLVFYPYTTVSFGLFLTFSFVSSAAILFLFNVDFLGVLFIIIYVGAIAVLFLFVVMMLNIKIYNKKKVKFYFCNFVFKKF